MKDINKIKNLLTEELEWEGDLDDDCVANLGGFGAHCEAMDKGLNEYGMSKEWWYFSVWKNLEDGSGFSLVHSTSDEMSTASGEAARKICEKYLRIAAICNLLGIEQEVSNAEK